MGQAPKPALEIVRINAFFKIASAQEKLAQEKTAQEKTDGQGRRFFLMNKS